MQAEVDITTNGETVTLWYNSTNTQAATYLLNVYQFPKFAKIKPKIEQAVKFARGGWQVPPTFFICVTSTYWGDYCSSWKSVGWNTGNPWGYNPQESRASRDTLGKTLAARLHIIERASPGNPLIFGINIEKPQPKDAGLYVLGLYWEPGLTIPLTQFKIQDMYGHPDYRLPERASNPLMPHMGGLPIAISNPTYEEVIAIETGVSETNLWLEWMKYNTDKQNQSNCYVCSNARPHLGTVPLNIPID